MDDADKILLAELVERAKTSRSKDTSDPYIWAWVACMGTDTTLVSDDLEKIVERIDSVAKSFGTTWTAYDLDTDEPIDRPTQGHTGAFYVLAERDLPDNITVLSQGHPEMDEYLADQRAIRLRRPTAADLDELESP